MTGLVRWNPFNEALTMSPRMDRMFERMWKDMAWPFPEAEATLGWIPALDFTETPEGYRVQLEVPGVKQEELDVTVEGNVLTIAGKRDVQEERKTETVHHVERRYGSFSRSVTLPAGVKSDAITAKYQEGVLELLIPKSEANRPRRIELKP